MWPQARKPLSELEEQRLDRKCAYRPGRSRRNFLAAQLRGPGISRRHRSLDRVFRVLSTRSFAPPLGGGGGRGTGRPPQLLYVFL
jgi:hypothetical protein